MFTLSDFVFPDEETNEMHDALHRTLVGCPNRIDSNLGAGFNLCRRGALKQEVRFTYRALRAVYVLCGTGTVTDHVTGKTLAFCPGSLILRKYEHPCTVLRDEGTVWLSFFCHMNKAVSDMLSACALLPQTHVVQLDGSPAIAQRCEKFYNHFVGAMDTNTLVYSAVALFGFFMEHQIGAGGDEFSPVIEKLRLECRSDKPVDQIAQELGMNAQTLRRRFKKRFGCSLAHYRILLRVGEAKLLLEVTDKSARQIASELGYSDEYAFGHQFKAITGQTPGGYREGRRLLAERDS